MKHELNQRRKIYIQSEPLTIFNSFGIFFRSSL